MARSLVGYVLVINAGIQPFGRGCYDQSTSFYEAFVPGTFDLGGVAGIWLGGAQTGKVRNDGTIKVVGDRTTGLYAQAVTGDVRVAGSISMRPAPASRTGGSSGGRSPSWVFSM